MAARLTRELDDRGALILGDVELEYRMVGPRPQAAPTIVLLHEGLGSAGLWRDFPERLAARTGFGVFAYSRQGYGASSACAPSATAVAEARSIRGSSRRTAPGGSSRWTRGS